MRALSKFGKLLFVLAALLVGMVLLISLPFAIWRLLSFLFRELELLFFFPGFLLYIFLVCVPLGLREWQRRRDGRPAETLQLPAAPILAGGAVLAIALGQGLLVSRAVPLFWPVAVLAAALPPLTALALASQRLPGVTTRRRVVAGLLTGSLLSTHATILLGAGVSLLAYLLVLPLRELTAQIVASKELERLFYSPALAVAMVGTAVVAPLVEELTKPLGAILLGRRLRSPAEAFLVGMAGGVGFAVLENLLYEAAGARLWAHIALLRGVGGALHPLNAGLVALGWYAVQQRQPGGWRRLASLYAVAVCLHALWNGGLTLLMGTFGAYFFGTDTWRLDVYGVGQPGVVIVFMLLESAVLWRLLVVVADRLREPGAPAVPTALGLHLERPRRLAVWAAGLFALVVPLGVLYGPLLSRYASQLMPLR